jgi:hypothetical protein
MLKGLRLRWNFALPVPVFCSPSRFLFAFQGGMTYGWVIPAASALPLTLCCSDGVGGLQAEWQCECPPGEQEECPADEEGERIGQHE